jgi:hypothetical protein
MSNKFDFDGSGGVCGFGERGLGEETEAEFWAFRQAIDELPNWSAIERMAISSRLT